MAETSFKDFLTSAVPPPRPNVLSDLPPDLTADLTAGLIAHESPILKEHPHVLFIAAGKLSAVRVPALMKIPFESTRIKGF